VLWVDETVSLRPGAAVALIQGAGDADIVYGDHDTAGPNGATPEFKPGFDLELFLARDYVTPVMTIRNRALAFPPATRQALYASVLLAARDGQKIAHVPRILGTVTTTPQQVADYRAKRLDIVGAVEPAVLHPVVADAIQIRREPVGEPKVTIVIPTQGVGWMLQPCLLPLLHLTRYGNYEIIVVHNGETGEPDLGAAKDDPRVKVLINVDPFNWSVLNNRAVVAATGDFILFLNDDTRIIEGGWLAAMVATAQQHGVGCVGARLLRQHGVVQHIGVVAHKGMYGHVLEGIPAGSPGLHGIAMLTHEAAAVTGACLLVSRKIFDQVGGFREELSHNYNDVAFCLDVQRLGFRNVVEVRAELTHLSGASRPGPGTEKGIERLMVENAIMAGRYLDDDPYWNPNFALTADGLGVRGLNYESLNWPGKDPDGRDRILVINDPATLVGPAAYLARSGAVVFLADASAFDLTMQAPALANGTWDIRDSAGLERAFAQMDIQQIVLCGMVGARSPAALELLRVLRALDIPVQYMPQSGEVACPRLTFERDGKNCNNGYLNGVQYCQACVDQRGSPFGHLDVEAWQRAWRDILPGVRHAAE
jgi:GT2 family glycosyltransferase